MTSAPLMKYLSRFKKSFKGKICLLRVDFNVEAGQEKDSIRFGAIAPTLKFLLKGGAKILILSHRGRPKKKNRELSLRPFIRNINAVGGGRAKFIGDFDFGKISRLLRGAPPRSVFLLENLRFLPGEEANDVRLAEKLASLGDFYVNDAFAVNHRANASVEAITEFLPSYAGFLLEKEVENLNRAIKGHAHPLILIVGGAKIGGKIDLIRRFLKKADHILVGGGIANTMLAAEGLPIGDSLFEPKFKKIADDLMRSPKIIVPEDFIVSGRKLLDIGPRTAVAYIRIIKKAKTVVWNGPLGFIEDKRFARGTELLAKAVVRSKAFSIVGGGETTSFMAESGLGKKMSFLSTGGGAMLEYLSGKKLPGIMALNRRERKSRRRRKGVPPGAKKEINRRSQKIQ